eukprot:scaffold102064_cov70-Phaeocystis_antarctica.AAC.2
MGSSSPSQPRIKPECTLFFDSGIEVAGFFLPPIGYTISGAYAGLFGRCFAPRSKKLGSLAARGIHGREA